MNSKMQQKLLAGKTHSITIIDVSKLPYTKPKSRSKLITLNEIARFHARGMKRVHKWRLSKWTEFSKYYTFYGEIWASKGNRLLVRFDWTAWGEESHKNYEICGMSATELFAMKFKKNSPEAYCLAGGTLASRDSSIDAPPPDDWCLSWVPECVGSAWEDWVYHCVND